MADVNRATDGVQAVEDTRLSLENAEAVLRSMEDRTVALKLADALREQVGEPANNVRFQLVVDEYIKVGQNFTRLGESIGLSRQRAQQLVAQARKHGIAVPPKSKKK